MRERAEVDTLSNLLLIEVLMAKKSLVAAVRTTPQTVLDDYARLLDLSKYQEVLDANATTILKNKQALCVIGSPSQHPTYCLAATTNVDMKDGFHMTL